MRTPETFTTFTAYLDARQGIVHEIIAEVSEGGAHRVVHSDIRATRETPAQIRESAHGLFGEAHVRVYTIVEA